MELTTQPWLTTSSAQAAAGSGDGRLPAQWPAPGKPPPPQYRHLHNASSGRHRAAGEAALLLRHRFKERYLLSVALDVRAGH